MPKRRRVFYYKPINIRFAFHDILTMRESTGIVKMAQNVYWVLATEYPSTQTITTIRKAIRETIHELLLDILIDPSNPRMLPKYKDLFIWKDILYRNNLQRCLYYLFRNKHVLRSSSRFY